MIRRVIPGTIASELVGVQPMSAPSSLADVFNMKLSFGINRVTVKNSDGVTFILIFSEDAGKERDDPRLLGAEVFFLCQGEEVLIFKETFVLPDDINGFSVISSASSEFEERIDEITHHRVQSSSCSSA